jgi:PAS domain S-box-containing protein
MDRIRIDLERADERSLVESYFGDHPLSDPAMAIRVVDGRGLARLSDPRLGALPPESPPVMALLDPGELATLLSRLRQACDDYLVRPLSLQQLVWRLESTLRRQQLPSVISEHLAHLATYHANLERSAHGVLILDAEGRCTHANTRAGQMLGMPVHDLRDRFLQDFVAPTDQTTFERLWYATDDEPPGLLRLQRPDGAVRWATLELRRLLDMHVQVVLRDVSDRRAAEEDAQLTNLRFDLLTRATGDAIWEANLVTMEGSWSEAFRRQAGFPVTTRPSLEAWLSRCHPDDREATRSGFMAAVASGQGTWEAEYRYRLADGHFGVVQDHGVFRHDSEGHVVRAVGIMRDVTEQRCQQQGKAFLASAAPLLAGTFDYRATLPELGDRAVDQFTDFCAIDLLEPDRTLCPLSRRHTDPAQAERVAQLRERESRARPAAHPLLGPEPTVVDCGGSCDWREVVWTEDAGPLWRGLELHSLMRVPIVLRGQVRGVFRFGAGRSRRPYGPVDLECARELVQLVAATMETAELYGEAQRALAQRDEFLSVAAHELRTPIATLRGYSQLLQRMNNEAVPQKPLAAIIRQTERIDRLVERLLGLSRLELGQFALYPRPVRLDELIGRCIAHSRLMTGRHAVVLQTSEPIEVPADPDRIEEVMSNLLENAAKFSPDDTSIEVSVWRADHRAEVSVADHGPGILPEQRPRLFQRLPAQTRGPLTAKSGLGLGLWICRQIVEKHGGAIECASVPGQGTTFTFWLPMVSSS